MPKTEIIAALTPEITAIRRDIHRHPELMYEVHRTAGLVADKLREWGVDEVVTGIGQTGVVGVIKGKGAGSGKVIGLRADMDALPIHEQTNLEHRSTIPGKMHACGHDGHTAMLLGAAKYLAETRDFDGTAVLIFQPAEEGGAGAKAMIDDGLITRFGIQEVYGMHNKPGVPIGRFEIAKGPAMAAADRIHIKIEGLGGHAAAPHRVNDPIVASCALVSALQTVASRNVNPLDSIVVSVTALNAGEAFNVIPQTAEIKGSVRTLTPEAREIAQKRITEIVEGVMKAFGMKYELEYHLGYPVTFNHHGQTDFVAGLAKQVFGSDSITTDVPPTMGSEDFSYMLEERPGAFINIGNGESAGLHHPAYEFNDAAIPVGVSYWASLIETAMPQRAA
ncbi:MULTISPECIES: M20 aminoacylase family protein [unclassified Bosea (in: a-proteobacteria)]|uniref:M20 aminoacylase family protein n=1 Tax=unclassified Bosea (in: a-proteobacteria) TaxID=2653178 RepID=UPI0009575179|nr:MULTISPECIES: M20 aminoacylase family protein [unclassified Bosea (in: a-proteobacteria)]TAJ27830.1 MAG: amidohydrolase [Bosea sp. (in: a-proteobacteria)]SIQ08570.1 hippurate hydrolase [Bosea sp. TND4EK4]